MYCLNDGEYSSFVSWDSPSEIFKEMLPVVLKVRMHTHACCLGVCMLHVLPHYCSVHAPPISPTHECYRVTNHMNHATRALSMVRAALQWMLLSKISNYQSWKWASGCSFQVSIAAQIDVTIIVCMHAYILAVSMCLISSDYVAYTHFYMQLCASGQMCIYNYVH